MTSKLPPWQPFRQWRCCQNCNVGRREEYGCVAHFTAMANSGPYHQYLIAWRTRKGLSQEQVANILGVNKSTVHRWETGKRAVDLNDLKRLADIYEVDPIALLLSPADADMARKITEAKAILEQAPADAGERWLATGRDIAGLPKK